LRGIAVRRHLVAAPGGLSSGAPGSGIAHRAHTIDIDAPIPKGLKRLQGREGKSLGRLVSDLLAQPLVSRRKAQPEAAPFVWISRPMAARVDLADKSALRDAMDKAAL